MANGLRVLKPKLYKIFSYLVYMEYHNLDFTDGILTFLADMIIITFYISQ